MIAGQSYRVVASRHEVVASSPEDGPETLVFWPECAEREFGPERELDGKRRDGLLLSRLTSSSGCTGRAPLLNGDSRSDPVAFDAQQLAGATTAAGQLISITSRPFKTI